MSWTLTMDDAPASNSLTRLEGVTLLLVEDDPDCRGVLTFLFETCGATVVAAASAREAVAAVGRSVPHVVVTDLTMPGEDGHWLVREINALLAPRGLRLPVIACSGIDASAVARSGRLAVFDGYISKPYEPARLCDLVAQVVWAQASRNPILRSA